MNCYVTFAFLNSQFLVVVSNSVNNQLRNMVILYMHTRIKKVDELKKLTEELMKYYENL